MAVRKDEVQISIAFLTDESQQYAKLVKENQQFIKDIKAARNAGKDLTEVVQKMAASGQEIAKIPLDKLAPTQLTQRAQQLEQVLDLIPKSAPEYKLLDAELKAINDEFATMKARSKGVAEAMDDARGKTGFFGRALQGAVAIFGGLSFASVGEALLNYGKRLFDIGTASDFFAQKTRTVFSDASVIVQATAEKLANALGFTKKEFRDAATRAGDLLVPMGFNQEQAARLSVELTKQAGILSQWSGGTLNSADAHEVLTKALLGERDGLDRLGVKVTDDIIQAELKKRGLEKLTGAELRQATALITLQQVTAQSASANEQFNKTEGNAVKTKAMLAARVRELTDGFANGLVPVFGFFINLAEKGLTLLIGLAKGFAAIPQFISENRVAILALVAGLVTLNAQQIALAANTLRVAVVSRGAAIATAAQTAAQWLLNAALTANPIGLVVTALAAMTVGLKAAYEKSDTFRAIVSGAFESVASVIGMVVNGLKDFGNGFKELFSGNWEAAAQSFKSSWDNLNPLEIAKTVGNKFADGFNQSRAKDAQKSLLWEDSDEVKNPYAKAGASAGDAFSQGLENQLKGLKNKVKIDPKEAAKSQKEALEAALKEVELATGREEIAIDLARLKKEIGEGEHAKRMFDLKKHEYEQELAIFKKFGKDQEKEALEIQKKLIELEASRPQKLAEVQQIGSRPLPGTVTSDKAGAQRSAAEKEAQINAESDVEYDALKAKFAGQVVLELDHEKQLALARVNAADLKLKQLKEARLTETEAYKKTLDEKKAADQDYTKTVAENEKRTIQLRRDATDAGLVMARDAISVGIELLGKDAAARKKHAGAIKAFEIGNIVVDGVKEVAGIWRNANSNPINALIPGWGTAFAIVQTALAAARSKVAINKIRAEKFGSGGRPKIGIFGGQPHASGGNRGVFQDGTEIEVERDETFVVMNKNATPLLRRLSGINVATGGVPFFAMGGLPLVNTTPVPGPSSSPSTSSAQFDFSGMMQVVNRFGQIVESMPREVRGKWVYSDFESAATEVQTVRNDASF